MALYAVYSEGTGGREDGCSGRARTMEVQVEKGKRCTVLEIRQGSSWRGRYDLERTHERVAEACA